MGLLMTLNLKQKEKKIAAFVIFGRKRLYGLLGKDKDLVITCEQIQLIGTDTVLVRIKEDICENKTKISRFKLENLLR